MVDFIWRRVSFRGLAVRNPSQIHLSHSNLGEAEWAHSSPLIYWSPAKRGIRPESPTPEEANSWTSVEQLWQNCMVGSQLGDGFFGKNYKVTLPERRAPHRFYIRCRGFPWFNQVMALGADAPLPKTIISWILTSNNWSSTWENKLDTQHWQIITHINIAANSYLLCKYIVEYWHPGQRIK